MKDKAENQETPLLVAPALCLDFDGTIRKSASGKTFIKGPDDIELMPGIERLIWTYRDVGYLIFGVSNQAGVAHGFKTPLDVKEEMQATINLFDEDPFHAVRWCTLDKKGSVYPYNHRSLLRKPDTGMLATLEVYAGDRGFVIDWDNSLFVGDRPEDEECAKRASIPFKYIGDFLKTGNPKQ